MTKLEIILIAVLVVTFVLFFAVGCQKISEDEALKIKVLEGALNDLSVDKNDYNTVELYMLKDTNAFILQLDEDLYVGTYNVDGNDKVYADVVKKFE